MVRFGQIIPLFWSGEDEESNASSFEMIGLTDFFIPLLIPYYKGAEFMKKGRGPAHFGRGPNSFFFVARNHLTRPTCEITGV